MRLIGIAEVNETGRNPYVYCCHQIPMNLIPHEVMLTEAIVKMLHLPWKRGKHVDPDLRPDGTVSVMFNGQPTNVHFEMFTGKQSNRQQKARARLYEERTDFVVWVADSERQLDRLRHGCARIANAQFMLLGSDRMHDRDGDETTVDQLCGSSAVDVLQP